MALVSNNLPLSRDLFNRLDVMPSSPSLSSSSCSLSNKKKRTLAESFGSDSVDSSFVELDLINDDESEDEGEIMLLAMILLQIHGVKLANVSAQNELDQSKKKRQRTSPEQLAILEHIFQTDKMPSQQTRIHLAEQLGMSSRRVQIWFQNKRAKVKRGVNKSADLDEPSSPLDDDDVSPSKSFFTSSSPDAVPSPSFASPIDHPSLSSATLSTLSLLNSSTSLVQTSPSTLKKVQIIPMKETSGVHTDLVKKLQS